MRILRFLIKASLGFILLQAVLISLMIIAMQSSALDGLPLVGEFEPLVVLSGSMEPTHRVGSVVIVSPADAAGIREGDIITFRSPSGAGAGLLRQEEQQLTTHRVHRITNENGRLSFETKGDANDEPDPYLVAESDVIGRAEFSVPYLGYASSYLRSRTGLLTLIAIAGCIILFETGRLAIQLRRRSCSGPC